MRNRVIAIGLSFLFSLGCLIPASGLLASEEKFDYRVKQKIEKSIASLQDKKGTIMRTAKKDLIAFGSNAVEPLIGVVKDWKGQPADLRVVCVDILGEIRDERAVPVIIGTLTEDKMTMRYNAARALGNIADKRAAPALIGLLNDKEWQVRFYAVEALGKIGDRSAVNPIADIMVKDANSEIKLAAIDALNSLDGKSRYKSVIELFSDNQPSIRSRAVELSAKWKTEEALPLIVRMLRDDRSNVVRSSCAYALGIYKNFASVPALIQALSDNYKDVRIYALESLKGISGQNYHYDQGQWSNWFEMNKDKQ
jgi:HEAT repeat protein